MSFRTSPSLLSCKSTLFHYHMPAHCIQTWRQCSQLCKSAKCQLVSYYMFHFAMWFLKSTIPCRSSICSVVHSTQVKNLQVTTEGKIRFLFLCSFDSIVTHLSITPPNQGPLANTIIRLVNQK